MGEFEVSVAPWFRKLFVLPLLWVTPAHAGTPPVDMAEAGTWQPRDMAFAHVIARQEARLGLPFAARIRALSVEPGVKVTENQVLLRFDAPRLLEHVVAWLEARHALTLARNRRQALGDSIKQHVVTRQEVIAGEEAAARAQGKARLAWETLAADFDLLHLPLDEPALEQQIKTRGMKAVLEAHGVLRAPFTGIVTQLQAALGEQVRAGETVLELEMIDRVYLDVGVPEARLSFWQAGETSWQDSGRTIMLSDLDGAPRYDAATGLWLLRYEADNPGGLLRDGAWVEVAHLGPPRPVVWAPAAAVVARNGKTWCVVAREGQYKPVEVHVGEATGGRVPVLSGLAAGAEVVTKGAYELLYRDLKDLAKFVD